MFKYVILVCAIIAYTAAKPSVYAPVALSAAPFAVAAPFVTATSSHYQAQNHHAFAAPVIASAPFVAAPAAYAASPYATSYAVSNGWNSPYAYNYVY